MNLKQLLFLAVLGTYTLRFGDRDHATFDFSVDGRAGSLPLMRQPFGPDP